MLQIDNIDVYYGKIQTLKNVSLSVNDGELVTLIGSNGAGKSTTLRTISGLLRPRQGSITYNGQRIDQLKPHDIVRLGVVHCPEGRRLFGHLTVGENLRLGAVTQSDSAEIERTRCEVYELFPKLEERNNQLSATLSGGEQQMLAIGRALMSRPKLLLLDEPSLGLAPLLVEALFAIIRQIKARGVTILLVEQNAWLALEVADRGYVMETGKIILADSAAALRTNSQVEEAYLGGGA
ncbi:MAG: ABC transporter ATP-binding protein [Anaerolineae bacterium]|nr:ABC transporter ATP-binding protein [Anaerolineae bacterium]MCA9908733.1 ABC transporter ATP-binding protein [Anaerolineae bacterium]